MRSSCPLNRYGDECSGDCIFKCGEDCIDRATGKCPEGNLKYLPLILLAGFVPLLLILVLRKKERVHSLEEGSLSFYLADVLQLTKKQKSTSETVTETALMEPIFKKDTPSDDLSKQTTPTSITASSLLKD
ncbi:uncharacterized protein LOC131929935 [Physella acuta]|uniref:uncharacterized protein LOC131929935 n=1 Tax=Physella acuta TaxID=109671 RepID=UPI0027DDC1AD|nr:uncharacterized protein LOC131929935 [Physella acuta]